MPRGDPPCSPDRERVRTFAHLVRARVTSAGFARLGDAAALRLVLEDRKRELRASKSAFWRSDAARGLLLDMAPIDKNKVKANHFRGHPTPLHVRILALQERR